MSTDLPVRLPLDMRVAAQFECGWEFNLTNTLTWRRWAFRCEVAFHRESRGWRCYWPRFFIRVLGFFIGVGFCYFPDRRKSAKRTPKEREIIDEAAPFTEAQWHRLRDWWRSLPVRVSSDGVASRADAAKRLRGKR